MNSRPPLPLSLRLRIPLILFFLLAGYLSLYSLILSEAVHSHFQLPADQGAALRFGMASALASGAVLLLALWLILDRFLVKPLSTLTARIAAIRDSGDLSARLDVRAGAELISLTMAFNAMMAEIEEARAKAAGQSFRLGMAEMAAGVLHNARNALTPLLGHLRLAQEALAGARLAETGAALAELAGTDADPGRREQLLEFLPLAVSDVKDRVEACQAKLEALSRVAVSLEAILGEQVERAGREGGMGRPAQAQNIVADRALKEAAALISSDLLVALDIVPAPLLAASPPFTANPVIVRQVFANIIANAAESVLRRGGPRGRLEVSAARAGAFVEIGFADNGAGFSPDQAARLFTRGFSTKDRPSGLGLHWCANALAAMGGRMAAASPGPGQGATVSVFLPAGSTA